MIKKLLITILSLMLISHIMPGISLTSFWSGLTAAIILGIVNLLIKPILVILTFPITILTLGLFLFVINASMLYLSSVVVSGFYISDPVSALLAAFMLSLINYLFNI